MGTYNGKKGNDTLIGSSRSDFINGREGNDLLWGRGGDDEIHGGIGSDQLYGEAGNDRLFGEDGVDYLYGGDGNDTLNGGNGDDQQFGGAGNDGVYGGAGNDALYGDDGADELIGSWGADTLTGGAGADRFYWDGNDHSNAAYGIDTVQDYNPAEDTLALGGYVDANGFLAGRQHWDYSSTAPAAPLTGANGVATVVFDGVNTTVSLYNVDGDTSADFIVKFAGNVVNPQFWIWVDGYPTGGFSDPAIIYPGG